ncbi:MAG TPA: hypothetical protein VIK40_08285, partial [Geomonas sp.]
MAVIDNSKPQKPEAASPPGFRAPYRKLSQRICPAGSFAAVWAVLTGLALLDPARALGAFHEQLAVDPRAISLANNVTADPPGLMSIHYNPAGLSLLG